ncbi:MAG: hypothetical protein U9O78_02620 [Patescibacteria group bacterium]|nr:hypothetical protein [Patescibacteria group bacterium]
MIVQHPDSFSQNIEEAIKRLLKFGLIEEVKGGFRLNQDIADNKITMEILKEWIKK